METNGYESCRTSYRLQTRYIIRTSLICLDILVSMLKKEKQKNANANRIDRSRDTELFSRETRSHGYSSNTEPSMNSREQSFQKEGSATSLRQESHVFSEEVCQFSGSPIILLL